MITHQEAFDAGVRTKNMNLKEDDATRVLLSITGCNPSTITVPAGSDDDITYTCLLSESDPPIEIADSFWEGYYS